MSVRQSAFLSCLCCVRVALPRPLPSPLSPPNTTHLLTPPLLLFRHHPSSATRTTTGGGAPSSPPAPRASTSSSTPASTSRAPSRYARPSVLPAPCAWCGWVFACLRVCLLVCLFLLCFFVSSFVGCVSLTPSLTHTHPHTHPHPHNPQPNLLATYLLYFGYMSIISLGLFLLTGAIGFGASLWFTRLIYGSIKVD